MEIPELRLELKIHAATLGEIAGGLETGRKIVLVSPKNFFDLRDLILEAERTIELLSVIQTEWNKEE